MSTIVENLLDNPLLGLEVAAGRRGLSRPIVSPELNRPSLELTGYFDSFRSERIQVLGKGEVTYVESHDHNDGLRINVARVIDANVPCAIVTNGRRPPHVVTERAEAVGIPVLTWR